MPLGICRIAESGRHAANMTMHPTAFAMGCGVCTGWPRLIVANPSEEEVGRLQACLQAGQGDRPLCPVAQEAVALGATAI